MDRVQEEREGADIFAADMIHVEVESKIEKIFEDATILLTGGTGFIGKMFLEKLLRACPKLKMIYLLVRPKKDVDRETRFEQIFEGPNMVPLKLSNPQFSQKVSLLNGDCLLPDLGLSVSDKSKMISEVNFVIHCAATVRFDAKLKNAAYINVRSVIDLISMSKQMRNLKGFLHVSTAYSNCHLETIDEKFYKPPMTGKELLHLVELLDDEQLENITAGLIGKCPNTYIFTKAIAEDTMKNEANTLPAAVLRPTIVVGSLNEPVSGWSDNFYGPAGVLVAGGLGLLRTMWVDEQKKSDMIPADYVVNAGLAILWDLVCNKVLNENVDSYTPEENIEANYCDIPVYISCSSVESPIAWSALSKFVRKYGPDTPLVRQIWHPMGIAFANRFQFQIAVFFLHLVPAYIVDFFCYCIGKKPILIEAYKKINKFLDVLGYFGTREWTFKNDNIQQLWNKLSKEDQRRFQFSMKNFDWENYFYFFIRGGRVYLLKDPLDTVPKARIRYWKLFIAHYTLMAVLLFLFYLFLSFLWRVIF